VSGGQERLPVRPPPASPAGRVVTVEFDSAVLAGNPWGDPTRRLLHVYLPPGYSAAAERYPVFWDLAAYTSAGPAHSAWRQRGENLPQRLDRLHAEGAIGPVICAMPDCYTSLGGNQYVDSPALGRYAAYLVDELVPLVDTEFRTIKEARGRAVFGKSSGGYGALSLVCRRPGVWGAVAAHAPDCGFDRVYFPEFPIACRVLAPYAGDLIGFVAEFWRRREVGSDDWRALMVLCLAASYDPDPAVPERLRLPFTLDTCELDPAAWARWAAFDPLHFCRESSRHLGHLAGLWLDAGERDEYHIQFGLRQLHQQLTAAGIAHTYETFSGGHRDLDWRLDHSLPYLYRALAAGGCPDRRSG